MVDRALMAAVNGSGPKRIMVFQPPRHGKSDLISKYFPAWYEGCHPDHHVIVASHTANLAGSFGRQARDLLLEWGPKHFGVSVDERSAAKSDWTIAGHDGGMLTAGVGGPLSGRGANVLVIDDPVKNAEEATSAVYRDKIWEWWDSTASTRLEPEAIVVVMMTRWHQDDLAGRLLSPEGLGQDQWLVISLPAIAEDDDPLGRKPGEALWPDRWPLSALTNIRESKTPYWWSAMYQQRPTQYGEAAWPAEYFADVLTDEWPKKYRASALAIDPSKGKDSKKGDFTAFVFVGVANQGLWIDAQVERMPPPQIVTTGLDWWLEKQPDIFTVEVNQFQELLATDFMRVAAERGFFNFSVSPIENMINKEMRIERLSGWLARKQVKIRNNRGGRELLRQLQEFPNCDHDDGPDAMEMAVRKLGEAIGIRGDGLGPRLPVGRD